jgi:hypothetical protein
MTSIRPHFIEDIRRQAQATSHEQRMRASERNQLRRNPDNDLFHVKVPINGLPRSTTNLRLNS